MMHTQTWNPERYSRNARFVADLGMPVVELLDPQPGERILDLGCGDGALTEKLVNLGCQVVGVDASPQQIEAARRRGLTAQVVDGHQLTFKQEFDAVFSNAALHWMKRSQEVIAGVWQALKPGGRFVGEFGGQGNVKLMRQALYQALQQRQIDPQPLDPWFFPSPEAYRQQLETQGFQVSFIQLIPRPTPIPGDILAWLETFAESFIFALPPTDRPDFLTEVREAVQPDLCDAQGNWMVDYVRLRFAATKPEAAS